MRLFVFRVPSTADVAILAEHLELLTPETHRLLRTDDANREVWMLLGVDEAEDAVPRIQNHLLKVNPRAKVTVSQAGPVRNLHSMATATWNAISGSSDHHWIDLSLNTLEGRADDIIRSLTEYSRADLIATVRTYMKHQGQWENAAHELHVHRNTLRDRMGIAKKLTNADFDDPDIASMLWLRLRDVTNHPQQRSIE